MKTFSLSVFCCCGVSFCLLSLLCSSSFFFFFFFFSFSFLFRDHVHSLADSFSDHVYCGRLSLVMYAVEDSLIKYTVEDLLWSYILWKTI